MPWYYNDATFTVTTCAIVPNATLRIHTNHSLPDHLLFTCSQNISLRCQLHYIFVLFGGRRRTAARHCRSSRTFCAHSVFLDECRCRRGTAARIALPAPTLFSSVDADAAEGLPLASYFLRPLRLLRWAPMPPRDCRPLARCCWGSHAASSYNRTHRNMRVYVRLSDFYLLLEIGESEQLKTECTTQTKNTLRLLEVDPRHIS